MSVLTVVTAAPSQDLTTLDALKQRLGIKTSSEDDNLRALISDASDAIATELNRVLRLEIVTEEFHSRPQSYGAEGRDHFFTVFGQWGYQTLVLTRRPVITVTEILDEAGNVIDPSLYVVTSDAGMVRISNNRARTFLFDSLWPHGKITVTYSGGYEDMSDVPRSLQRACIRQVTHWRSSEGRDPYVKSEEVPGVLRRDYWIGAVGDNGSLCPEVLDLITKFRDIAA